MESITASPLTWPHGWKRTKDPVQRRFVIDALEEEHRRGLNPAAAAAEYDRLCRHNLVY